MLELSPSSTADSWMEGFREMSWLTRSLHRAKHRTKIHVKKLDSHKVQEQSRVRFVQHARTRYWSGFSVRCLQEKARRRGFYTSAPKDHHDASHGICQHVSHNWYCVKDHMGQGRQDLKVPEIPATECDQMVVNTDGFARNVPLDDPEDCTHTR